MRKRIRFAVLLLLFYCTVITGQALANPEHVNQSDLVSLADTTEPIYSREFSTQTPGSGWQYQYSAGSVDSKAPAGHSGLCLGVPRAGINIGQWNQTADFIDLVPNAVWRLRATMNSNQAELEKVPLFDFVYDNFTNPGISPNAYGGDYLFLGNEGGANAPSAGGRSDYEVWFTPLPILTPQFNDPATGAFTTANAPLNDMRVYFRVIDADGAGYNAENDLGAVCMENIEIWRYDMDELEVTRTLYDAQEITTGTHTVIAEDTITTFADGDVTVAPADPAGWSDHMIIINPGDTISNIVTGEGMLDNWPVPWESERLLRITCDLSGANPDAEPYPPNVLRIGADTPTTELLATNNVTRNFNGIGMPKQIATVGGVQTYTAFFYTHSETRSLLPNSHQLRPRFDMFAVRSPFAVGLERFTGAITLHCMKVEEVRLRQQPEPPQPIAPVIQAVPDIVIGDEGHLGAGRQFVYPDAVDLADFIDDEDTPTSAIRWSYETVGAPIYSINNTEALDPNDSRIAPGAKAFDRQDTYPARIDENPLTITVRDRILSPIGAPDAIEPIEDHSQVVTFWASDGAHVTSRSIVIWTDTNSDDRVAPQPPVRTHVFDFSNPDDRAAFRYDSYVGSVTSSYQSSGLCLSVPLSGVNIGQWRQTTGFLSLVPNSIWQVRVNMSTTQNTLEFLPLWDLLFENYVPNSPQAFSGDALFFSLDGGANGIGANARTEFEAWFTPACVFTPQFNDPYVGAFTPAKIPLTDMRLTFRVIDADGAGYNAESDQGTVCMQSMEIWRYDLDLMTIVDTPYFVDDIQDASDGDGTHHHVGQNTIATYSGGDVTLAPQNPEGWSDEYKIWIEPGDNFYDIYGGNGVLDNWPLDWNENELLMVTCMLSGANVEADTNPPPILTIGMDTPHRELMVTNTVNDVLGGIMMPKQVSTVIGPQPYVAFFQTHAETRSSVPNAHRLRPRFELTIRPSGSSSHHFKGALTLHSMRVDRVVFPNM